MAAVDDFYRYDQDLTSPGSNAVDVVTSDVTDLVKATRGLYIGTGGHVKVTMVGGQTITYKNAVTGLIYPYRVTRVWQTGTTATDIIAVW